MKRTTLIIGGVAGLFLGGTQAMADQVKTRQQFIDEVAGKKLVQDDAWVIVSPDGTVEGAGPNGGKISGAWSWDDGFYCRDITINGVAEPRDCQRVVLDGNTVSFVHDKGEGISVDWTIE